MLTLNPNGKKNFPLSDDWNTIFTKLIQVEIKNKSKKDSNIKLMKSSIPMKSLYHGYEQKF